MKLLPSILLSLFFYSLVDIGCNTSDINDQSKRNLEWVWWVDISTAKGQWIPMGKKRTVKNGKYTKFYYNGQVYEKGTIKEGKDVDTTFWFDLKNDIFAYTINNVDSAKPFYIKDGYLKVFAANGKILSEGIIKNHTVGENWTVYYKTGFVSETRHFIHDTGWIMRYYENQQIADSFFAMGDLYGEVKHWFENGQVAHSVGWKNYHYDGELKDYYDNGQLKQSAYYRNGKVDGRGMYWYRSGQLNGIFDYVDGEKTGQQIIYFENGQIQLSANTVNGKLEGEQKIFNEQGILIEDHFFENGLRIR
jgi:antitoxin component YwqK of YwqJK toxin-antitoxin module